MRRAYQDEVVCDVVEMEAFHLLLRRLWQYDVHAVHDGRANTYSFAWKGTKIKVIPSRTEVAKTKEGKKTLLTINDSTLERFNALLAEIKGAGNCMVLVVKGETPTVVPVPPAM